jgi:hypothetical protein
MIKDGIRAAFYKPTNFEIPLISIVDLNKTALLRIFNYIKGGFVGISNYNINDTKEIYEEREHFFKAFFNIIDYKFLEISSYNLVHFFESIIVVPTMISDKIDVDYLRNVMRILCKSSKQDHYIYFKPENNPNDLCMWCNKYGEEIPPNNNTNSHVLNKFQFFV